MPGFGRIVSPADTRDLLLRELPRELRPLDVALATFRKTGSRAALVKWMELATAALNGKPPTPPAPPANLRRLWRDSTDPIFDQGETSHCVGFSGAGLLADPEPRFPDVTDETGHEIYYGCKVLDDDGARNREAGSYVRTLAKELQRRGRIGVYAFAKTADEVTAWLQTRGPVVVGTDWYEHMMDPDQHGRIHPQGSIVGGHAYLLVGAGDNDGNPDTDHPTTYVVQNSWGRGWGRDGTALIDIGDFRRALLEHDGEALVTLELPVA